MVKIDSRSKANLNSAAGKAFSYSWHLDKHRKDMVENAIKKTKHINANRLEKLLNDLQTVGQREKYFKNGNEIFKKIDSSIQTFINNLTSFVEVDDNGECYLTREKNQTLENNENLTRIKLTTLAKKIEDIFNIINNINPKTIEEIAAHDEWKKINYDINSIMNQISQVVMDNNLITEGGFLRNATEDTAKAIEDLNLFYQAIRAINYGKNTPQAYGAAFERKLDLFSQLLRRKAEEETNRLIDEVFATTIDKENKKVKALYRTTGDTSTKRGNFENSLFNIQGKQKILRSSETHPKDDLCEITAFDEKSGKMDVKFILPNEVGGNLFRISAKSWNGLVGKDFGSTSLFNALARSGGLDDTFAYGITVGYYNPIGKLREDLIDYHAFAKTCIFLDIVMGYSQAEGYADTIVIEDRKMKKIKVIAIYDLLKLVENSINNINSIVYKYDTINIRKFLKLNKNANVSAWWANQLKNQMHNIKVSVTSGILNEI